MLIRLDSATTSAVEQIAQQRGKTVEKLIEDLIKNEFRQQQGRVKDTSFATIYDTANGGWQPRFDADDPNLKDRVRQDVARDMMIARMQRGKHPVASELSEQEARRQCIERLNKVKKV